MIWLISVHSFINSFISSFINIATRLTYFALKSSSIPTVPLVTSLDSIEALEKLPEPRPRIGSSVGEPVERCGGLPWVTGLRTWPLITSVLRSLCNCSQSPSEISAIASFCILLHLFALLLSIFCSFWSHSDLILISFWSHSLDAFAPPLEDKAIGSSVKKSISRILVWTYRTWAKTARCEVLPVVHNKPIFVTAA